MANKIGKWDLKRVAKLLGLEWSTETEQKLVSLTQPNESSEFGPILLEEKPDTLIDNIHSKPSEPEHTGFCIVESDNGRTFNVCKLKFDLTEVEISGKYDTEARAIFERGKLEADNRANEFRKRRQNDKK